MQQRETKRSKAKIFLFPILKGLCHQMDWDFVDMLLKIQNPGDPNVGNLSGDTVPLKGGGYGLCLLIIYCCLHREHLLPR